MSAIELREVRAEEADWRFDRWCRHHFPGLAHGHLQKLMRTGQFRLDGRRVKGNERLAPGQRVRVPPLDAAAGGARPAPARQALRPEDAKLIRSLVLHEDEHLIVLEKPPGLAVQGGTGTHRHIDGMLEALARGGERPKLVHRLDKETSGILVVARTAAAARFLAHAFRTHRVRKLYWAVVVGEVRGQEGLIDLPLLKQGGAGREKIAGNEEGRHARTRWRVIQRAGKVGAWLGLLPLTGRTHQLRAHAAAMGWPILGDGKYGGKAAHPSTAPDGLMLHARELELPHPAGGVLNAVAKPSRVFKEGLAWLGMTPEILPGSRLADWPD